MFQNTEKHNIFVYAFLKTSEKSPVLWFCPFIYYSQTSTVREHKTNRVTNWICMNLSLPNLFFISKKSGLPKKNSFPFCINWTFQSSPLVEEQFIVDHS